MLIIGEKINGTLKGVKEAIVNRDADVIKELASAQEEAGADYIDINVGTGSGEDESESMEWAVSVVREATELPLALDSSSPEVLSRGLAACGDEKPFINSISGEQDRLEGVLPLVAEHSCPVIALAMDSSGIPGTSRERMEVCLDVAKRVRSLDIREEDVYFDPLVLPVSADSTQGNVTLGALQMIKRELPGFRTVLGLSNVSFGLPGRTFVNRALLTMAVFLGLDAALMDPADKGLVSSAFAAEAVTGEDRYCREYIKAYRSGLLG